MNPIAEALIDALDFFFRRRPPLAALMWHPETFTANKLFTIPPGKIYEVYVYSTSSIMLNGIKISDGVNCWAPYTSSGIIDKARTIQWTQDGTPEPNAVFDESASSGADIFYTYFSMAPKGWILSENEVLTSTGTFKVRWRDVTDVAPF